MSQLTELTLVSLVSFKHHTSKQVRQFDKLQLLNPVFAFISWPSVAVIVDSVSLFRLLWFGIIIQAHGRASFLRAFKC